MQGFAKAILISMIVTIALFVFTSFIYFFPWYTTLVVETFNLSQIAAGDNYVKQSYYDDTLNRLQGRPIFKRNPNAIKISIENEDGNKAVGYDDESVYENLPEEQKPYNQRGKAITVKIDAVYPLTIKLWGQDVTRNIDVSFSMNTVGLKHYKDLDYYFD